MATLIRFTRGAGLAGAIVRIGTWATTAHVGFKLDDGTILDAYPGIGVSIREDMDDQIEDAEYWSIAAPRKIIADAVEWAKGQIGKPYDWSAVVGFAFHRDWHKDTSWFCSELITAAFDHAGWPIVRDSGRFNRISPRDLMIATRIQKLDPQPLFR